MDKSGRKLQSILYGFKKVRGIAVDEDDNIYLTDFGSGKLFKFNRNYELVKELNTKTPWGITVKDNIMVESPGHSTHLHIFDRELNLERTIALETIGVRDIMGIAVDVEHMHLYVCDYSYGGISLKSQVHPHTAHQTLNIVSENH